MGLGSSFISAVQHNIYPSSGLTASPESRLRQIRRKTSQKKNKESGTTQGREHTRYYILILNRQEVKLTACVAQHSVTSLPHVSFLWQHVVNQDSTLLTASPCRL